MRKLTDQRLGLVMIMATLLVIAIVCWALLKQSVDNRQRDIRVQGTTLTRVLANMPLRQLVPDTASGGTLQLLKLNFSRSDLAYVVVVNPRGQPLAEIVAPGAIVPAVQMSAEPSAWLTEHELQTSGPDVIEFRIPLVADGDIAAHLRTAYFAPGFGIAIEDLPLFAQLALPIFLLTPLFYYLVRREMSPLHNANQRLHHLLQEHEAPQVQINPSGEFQDFIDNFNRFVSLAQTRSHELSLERTNTIAASRVLSYQKDRIESALQTLPDAVLILDDAGTAIFVNSKFEPLLGVTPEQTLGMTVEEWCTDPQLVQLLTRYDGNVTRLMRSDRVEISPPGNPNNSLSVSAYPLSSPKNVDSVIGTVVVFRNVTDEVLARHARDEFISHVAHELKSPLNVVNMQGELLLDHEHLTEDQRVDAINVIHDEVHRLSKLIDDLLNITKIDAGSIALNRQRVKLKEFLEDTFQASVRSAGDAQVEAVLDLPKTLSTINADKDLLRIALNNLLSNSIKYNRPGGSVTLHAEDKDDRVRITVSDTGIGIKPEDQTRIFDKFYRSEAEDVRKRPGHGLGLALSHEIVSLHNGRLTVVSQPGATSFTIDIAKGSMHLKEAVA